jgi:hypothetical protein
MCDEIEITTVDLKCFLCISMVKLFMLKTMEKICGQAH